MVDATPPSRVRPPAVAGSFYPEEPSALRSMVEACLAQAVTVAMIERVRQFLERLPWHPGLRFEPALFA